MVFSISDMLRSILFSCVIRTERYFSFDSLRLDFMVLMIMSISLCNVSPLMSISPMTISEFLIRLTFWPRISKAISWYSEEIDSSNSCKSLCNRVFLFSKVLIMSTFLCCWCSPKEIHVAQIGMSHSSQWSSHYFCGMFWAFRGGSSISELNYLMCFRFIR